MHRGTIIANFSINQFRFLYPFLLRSPRTMNKEIRILGLKSLHLLFFLAKRIEIKRLELLPTPYSLLPTYSLPSPKDFFQQALIK